MPPVPTCDISFDHQLTVHATWPAESRPLLSRIPVNKILFTSTGPLDSGSALFPGMTGNIWRTKPAFSHTYMER